MSSDRITAALVKLVRQRAAEQCEYCRIPQSSQEATFHVDHIKPRSAGGLTVPDNLALACVSCSLRKAARTEVRDPRSGAEVAIFNPRTDRWSEHFLWTPRWQVKGTTPTGRATCAALLMNRPAIVGIRQQLAALNAFPPLRRIPR
jgi:HNH endonuclease